MELLNFFPLAIPSNIYGLARLKGDNKSRILVTTLEKRIFCIEHSLNQFKCSEIHFAYIPNGAEIISIDTFERSLNYNDTVVGITFKNSKESDFLHEFRKNISVSSQRASASSDRNRAWSHYYFNIYSSLISNNRFDLNQIAQDCQTFELDFVPFHLYHTNLHFSDKSYENVWLLSGSDCCVHIFREDTKKQCFYKDKIDLFPELSNFKSICLWIDVMNVANLENENRFRRFTSVGCEDGSVELFLIEYQDPVTPQIVRSWKNQFDGPVLSVRLFQDQSNAILGSSLYRKLFNAENVPDDNIHLLVVNSFESPIVYRNIQKDGILRKKHLPSLNKTDILISTFIDDFNFDGFNEIVIGSYGKELIIYKYDRSTEQYVINGQMKLAHPLQTMAYLDLTGNGINELVVITSKGVEIHSHKISEILQVLEHKTDTCLQLFE